MDSSDGVDRGGILAEEALRILDSLNDGVYVTDLDRRILYWSRAAERITGWKQADVIGKQCSDNVLCHVDKDGHRLCGKEYCPLHRCIVTGNGSTYPLTVFARGADGRRIPMQVSVAPVRGHDDEIIGGVETFRDVSSLLPDLERARNIQQHILHTDLPEDSRISVAAHYIPVSMVGGDYYAVAPIDGSHYGFLLADVTGHGVSSALYTMQLHVLWNRYNRLLAEPRTFLNKLNDQLHTLIGSPSAFATALCGVVDLHEYTVTLASAGGPRPVRVRRGNFVTLDGCGLPLGLVEHTNYEQTTYELAAGDTLLLFSDGAYEVYNRQEQELGVPGLIRLLADLGYPEGDRRLAAIEGELLRYSNDLRLPDDLTLLELQLRS
ncbi:MAG: SpoIIE family protein phosphatase [Candidatus Hydrogenedentes bacterium]|nr:SpoIIE family protein phosphatase [Candidatus Hydrogenedentota bacterium]